MQTISDDQALFHAPEDDREWPAWREALVAWRIEAKRRIGYDDRLYRDQSFAWARRCVIGTQLLLCDQMAGAAADGFDLTRFLRDGQRRFGGYDVVLLWQSYPDMGFDERNQFDLFRDQPGGIDAVARAVAHLRSQGTRVLVPYQPWDRATRRPERGDDEQAARLVGDLGADGLFLDTMDGAHSMQDALQRHAPGAIMQPEGGVRLDQLHAHHSSWASHFHPHIPGVWRNRWLEPRHLPLEVDRWAIDKGDLLHTAWMNGMGLLTWENSFGRYYGWQSAATWWVRMLAVVRRAFAEVYEDGVWTPLTDHPAPSVFGSRFALGGITLHHLVNRGRQQHIGLAVQLDDDATSAWDLARGCALPIRRLGSQRWISLDAAPRALMGVAVERGGHEDLRIQAVLRQRRAEQDILDRDEAIAYPAVVRRPMPATDVQRALPPGFAAIPAGDHLVTQRHRRREVHAEQHDPAFFYAIGPFHRSETFQRIEAMPGFAIAKHPVTNGEFLDFLRTTGYRPNQSQRLLHHLQTPHMIDGVAADGAPVVCIDLEDARAYAAWRGARLPSDREWSVAAHAGLVLAGTRRVWEWTESEDDDGRFRSVWLCGGGDADLSARDAQQGGSLWYPDAAPDAVGRQGLDPAWRVKTLLHWPGRDRWTQVGFRLAIDR